MDETAQTRHVSSEYVARLEARDWPGVAALLDADVVYEMPQTRERIRGRDAFLRFNTEYPGDWHLAVRRVVADGRFAALWLDTRVGDERQDACVWLEVGGTGLVTRVVDYWPDSYEPPAGREHLAERY
jgi:hypothetical protein